MTREIVIDALRMAWFKCHPGKQGKIDLSKQSDSGRPVRQSRLQGCTQGVRHRPRTKPPRGWLDTGLCRSDAVRAGLAYQLDDDIGSLFFTEQTSMPPRFATPLRDAAHCCGRLGSV